MSVRPLIVGDVVKVARECLGNPSGSIAVVVEVYDRQALGGDGHGVTLLFANGMSDGFSPDDVLTFGVERLGHLPQLQAYRYTSVGALDTDYRRGVFSQVWVRGWI